MQYLIIGRAKELLPPADHLPAIAESGIRTIEYLKDLEGQGKVKISGAFGVEWGGFMVLDVDSYDEVSTIILMCPGTTSINWEVYPIVTWQGVSEALTEFGDKARERIARRKQGQPPGQGTS